MSWFKKTQYICDGCGQIENDHYGIARSSDRMHWAITEKESISFNKKIIIKVDNLCGYWRKINE